MPARIVALEEHFWTPELVALRRSVEAVNPKSVERLGDLGELRLAEMDVAGIDIQVLSEAEPGAQNLEPDQAVALARVSNDLLHEAVKRHPDRFAGFATLPTPDPPAAAKELERCVNALGFCGAMVHGSSRGHFLDERQFWPILECAQALDVPIYLHPSTPPAAVFDAYYKDYPVLSRAALGFGIEMAVQAARLVMSGAFDEFPRLKIVLGHLGEGVPFLLWRTDDTLARRGRLKRRFGEYFRDHFHITTSGNFSHPALQCTIAEMGVGRILFAVDWPFQPNADAVAFINDAELGPAEREQIFAGNAHALLRIPISTA
ncbi:MAG TPA: amidohydrolase family protein [Xanthobacteraceae bacterium]